MGFLSTVPEDAGSQLVSAIATIQPGDEFPGRFFFPPFPPFFYSPSLQPYRKRHQAEPSNPPERRLTAYLWPQVQAARRRQGLVVPRRDRRAVRSRQGGWGWGLGWLLGLLGLLGCCNCGRDVRGRFRGGGILDLSIPSQRHLGCSIYCLCTPYLCVVLCKLWTCCTYVLFISSLHDKRANHVLL